jgi:hypothetical protein
MAVVGVAFLVHSVARGSVHERADWQSWLDARSSRPSAPTGAAQDKAAEPIHPSRLGTPIAQDMANEISRVPLT